MLEHAPLEAVYIYFDTATYDEIEKDEKVILQILFKQNTALLSHVQSILIYIVCHDDFNDVHRLLRRALRLR